MNDDKSYHDWRRAVDRRLNQIYCITIVDVGFDEQYLMNHWRSNATPFEFAQWFGNKYDLDAVPTTIGTQGR